MSLRILFDYGYPLVAALLAVLTPVALILTRTELGRARWLIVENLRRTLFKDARDLPQLELLSARYLGRGAAGELAREAREEKDGGGPPAGVFNRMAQEWAGALIFALVSFAGFGILFIPLKQVVGGEPAFPTLTYALFWGSKLTENLDVLRTSVAVAGVAFLGGYVFQLRFLIRAALNQELSAMAFVRGGLTILQGVILAQVVYRVAQTASGQALEAPALTMAFVIGYWPDLGLTKLTQYARTGIKRLDTESLKQVRQIPLEIIDGIDSETSVRLQESNLYDVQNLATINPIELYAETPFTLFQSFDWVLQAQLCVVVGPGAFLALKQHNIRTIFDLERAVLAEGAPAAYVEAIGSILFTSATGAFRARIGLPETPQAAVAEPEPANDEGAEAQPTPTQPLAMKPPPIARPGLTVDSVRHAVAIVADDLHIHRLRSLWRAMLRATREIGEDGSDWLYATGMLPGEPGGPRPLPAVVAAKATTPRRGAKTQPPRRLRRAGRLEG